MNFQRQNPPALFSSIAGTSQQPTRRETALTQDDFPALLGGPRFEPRPQEQHYAASLRTDPSTEDSKAAIQAQLLGTSKPNDQQRLQPRTGSTGLGTLPPPSTLTTERTPDDFTLLGLLDIIKMTNQDTTMLTLGIDLTTLGLPLSTFQPLHTTFISPYASDPSSGATPSFTLPPSYTLPTPTPPILSKLSLFSEDALFYAFYTKPRDEVQEACAQGLYRRGWRFHREVRLWVRREEGKFVFFDPVGWNRVKKEFVMNYEMLEERKGDGDVVDTKE